MARPPDDVSHGTTLSEANRGGAQRTTTCCGVTLRSLVSKKKLRFVADGVDLDLAYITDRVVAMGFPSVGLEAAFRNPASEVKTFLESRHGGRYRIWNLCVEKDYVAAALGLRCDVERFCWADHTPPPLAMMRPACESMRAWLESGGGNVAVVHCKAGKGRTGTLIAAFLVHTRACADADAAMILFGERRTRNGRGVTIPSQMRSVRYWAGQRAALDEAADGWQDPLPPPAPMEVGQDDLALTPPRVGAEAFRLGGQGGEGGGTTEEEAEEATRGKPACGRVLWQVQDQDDLGAWLLHIEVHRDGSRRVGMRVGPDVGGRLLVHSISGSPPPSTPPLAVEAPPAVAAVRPRETEGESAGRVSLESVDVVGGEAVGGRAGESSEGSEGTHVHDAPAVVVSDASEGDAAGSLDITKDARPSLQSKDAAGTGVRGQAQPAAMEPALDTDPSDPPVPRGTVGWTLHAHPVSLHSVLCVGDEILAVGDLDVEDVPGSGGLPGRIKSWREGVARLQGAPDPVFLTVRRWPALTQKLRADLRLPPVTATEYVSRVLRAVGPFAPGSDPRQVPAPWIQVTSIALSHEPAMKKGGLAQAVRDACRACLCWLNGSDRARAQPTPRSALRVQLFGGPLCRTLLFDSASLQQAPSRVPDWAAGARGKTAVVFATSAQAAAYAPVPVRVDVGVGGEGPQQDPDRTASPAATADSEEEDDPEVEGGVSIDDSPLHAVPAAPASGAAPPPPSPAASTKQADKGGLLGPGPAWEAPAAVEINRELAGGVHFPLDAGVGPLLTPAVVFGAGHFSQALPYTEELALARSVEGSAGQSKLSQLAGTASAQPRQVLIAGDFRVVLRVGGVKKPVASAWLHTSQLPLPGAARKLISPMLAPLQAAVQARGVAAAMDQAVADKRAARSPSLTGAPVTFRRTPTKDDPTEGRQSTHTPFLIAGAVQDGPQPVLAPDAPDAEPADGESSVAKSAEPGPPPLLSSPPPAPLHSVLLSSPRTTAARSTLGIGGDILASHARPGTPTLGALLTAGGTSLGGTGASERAGGDGPTCGPETAHLCEGSLVLVKRQLDGPGGVKDKKHKVWASTMRLALTYRVLQAPEVYLRAAGGGVGR